MVYVTAQQVKEEFIRLFNQEPLVVRSPGRINLIGEHVDYNNGFVMPAAIDKEIYFALYFTDQPTSSLISLNFGDRFDFDVHNPQRSDTPRWANYVLGVVDRFLQEQKELRQFVCVFGGNIPTGAGVSSSAALECGFGFALNALHHHFFTRTDLMYMGQWSEHNYVGVKCGIMDQFANMMGKVNHAMLLDCRSMDFRYVPLNWGDHEIVLFDSRVKHSLGSSAYNTRRSECEQAVRVLATEFPAVTSLRDATPAMLEHVAGKLSPDVRKRATFIVQEIDRVVRASHALEQHNVAAFGAAMYECHDGLSDLYEVSCDELDFLVDEVSAFPAVVGSRMMGGGFGGCTINLIKSSETDMIINKVGESYRKRFQLDMLPYRIAVLDGTNLVR